MRISDWSSDVCLPICSCFPKDTLALIHTAQKVGSPMRIVETVSDVNDRRKRAMAARIVEACDDSVNGKTVAILGVTFKPNTDDMREASRLDIVHAPIGAGAKVRDYDHEGPQPERNTAVEGQTGARGVSTGGRTTRT